MKGIKLHECSNNVLLLIEHIFVEYALSVFFFMCREFERRMSLVEWKKLSTPIAEIARAE